MAAKVALLSLVLAASSAWAASDDSIKVKVLLGEVAPLNLPMAPKTGKCADATIARLEIAPGQPTVQVSGLREGKTLCAFREDRKGQTVVVEVEVVATHGPSPAPALDPGLTAPK